MDSEKLREIVGKQEGVKLDFKRELYKIFDASKEVRRREWDEFIKDILALLNGNVGTQGQTAYLIIGVGNKINLKGSRDLFDVGEVPLDAKQILDHINPACEPPVPDIECKTVLLDGFRIFVITIPPSPHLHETTRPLEPKENKKYTERIVFIRRGESILPATTAETQAILSEKERFYKGVKFHSSYSLTIEDFQSHHLRPLAIDTYLENIVLDLSDFGNHYIKLSGVTQLPRTSTTGWPQHLIPTSFRLIDFQSNAEEEKENSTLLESIEAALQIHKRFVLLGSPGSGKTRTLMKLQLETAKRALKNHKERIPILIKLAQWPEDITEITEFLNYQCRLKGLPELHFGRLLILLDGLNEMPGTAYIERVRKLKEWLVVNSTASLIITCRERDYREREKIPIPTVQISPLDEGRIRLLLHAYLGSKEGDKLLALLRPDELKNRSVRDLIHFAKNPYMLIMIIYVYKQKGALPSSRGELFRLFVKTLFGREEARYTTGNLTYEEFILGLSKVAFAMLQKRTATSVKLDWAAKFVPGHLSLSHLWNLGAHSTVLELSEADLAFQFSHQLLLEYFAAENLQGNYGSLQRYLKRTSFKNNKRVAGQWDEVIYTLVGIDEPNQVLNKLGETDPFLAAECLKHIPSNIELEDKTLEVIVNKIINYFESNKSAERVAAVSKLIDLGSLVLPQILNVIKSGSVIAKRASLDVLAELSGPQAYEGLVLALNDRNRWVRREAMDIICNLEAPEIYDVIALICLAINNKEPVSKEMVNLLILVGDLERIYTLNCLMNLITEKTDGQRIAGIIIEKGDSWVFESFIKLLIQALACPSDYNFEKILITLSILISAFEQNLIKSTPHLTTREVLSCHWLDELLPLASELEEYCRPRVIEFLSKIKDLATAKLVVLETTTPVVTEAEILPESNQSEQIRFELTKPIKAGYKKERKSLVDDSFLPFEFESSSFEEKQEIENLLELLNSPGVGNGNSAIKALSAMGERAVEPLIYALSSTQSRVRRRACRALMRIRDQRAVPPLISLLDDPDKRIRQHAVKALTSLGDKSIIEFIMPLLSDGAIDVREHVIKFLRSMGDRSLIPALVPILNDTSGQIQNEAALTLALWGYEPAVEFLIQMLTDKERNTNTRVTAASHIGKIKAQQAFDPLISILSDNNSDLIAIAIKSLGHLGNLQAAESIKIFLNDSEVAVRRAAVKALGDLRDESAGDLLIQSLNDQDDFVQIDAIESLVVIGNSRIIQLLPELISRKDTTVRSRITKSLSGLLKFPGAVSLLNYLVNDKDSKVSVIASETLSLIENQKC